MTGMMPLLTPFLAQMLPTKKLNLLSTDFADYADVKTKGLICVNLRNLWTDVFLWMK